MVKKTSSDRKLTQNRKGASTTNLVTVALTKMVAEVLHANNIPGGVFTMISGSGGVIGVCKYSYPFRTNISSRIYSQMINDYP